MTNYLFRTCPKCKGYLEIVIPEPKEPATEIPIDAICLRCSYRMPWKVVIGIRRLEQEA